jgi:hypothetical protein
MHHEVESVGDELDEESDCSDDADPDFDDD